jgi:hypothetical protein
MRKVLAMDATGLDTGGLREKLRNRQRHLI